MISSAPFGTLPTGETVHEYILSNHQGLRVHIITYGGIITQLHVPDRHGNFADIVLGFSHLESYLQAHPYFGCIVGRVAGRLTGASISIQGITYPLAQNEANSSNHIHGGWQGFDKRLWQDEPVLNNEGSASALRLRYESPDGEEGYPGHLQATVTYTLTEENELILDYSAKTSHITPYSPTNHSYFNLSGEGTKNIDEHWLQIFADRFTPTDETMTYLGRVDSVCGQKNNFTEARHLGEAIPELFQQHGDNYLLSSRDTSKPLPAAVLSNPASGRVMEVATTASCLQLYTGKFLDGTLLGKSGKQYGPRAGLCLECQGYPDGVRHPAIDDILLHPGQTYRQITTHRFKTC
jgi:aldose 1-epimerase